MHYAQATQALRQFVETHNVPAAETQAGKAALMWDHPLNLGSIGVTEIERSQPRSRQAPI